MMLALSLIAGCALPFVESAERDPILIPTFMEVSLGEQTALEIASQYRIRSEDDRVSVYVSAVGQRMADLSDRKDVGYSFLVMDENTPNAFALPGGYVYVTTGLLKMLEDEAELAAVLGHEIGHVEYRHSVRLLQRQLGYDLLVSLALKKDQTRIRQVANLMATGVILKNSRTAELQADRAGATLAARAKYDPEAAIGVQRKLMALSDRHPGVLEVFFSTHPPSHERIAELQKGIPEIPGLWTATNRHPEKYRAAIKDL